ncbi:Alpha/Beta hydrolase protein [Hyaloraphidium curvatum]|nr:Alpha/Beta hydrolase protein [Hyaloraphidium curvatum]
MAPPIEQRDVQLAAPFGAARVWVSGDPSLPAVLLVHGGLGGAMTHWRPLIERLSDAFHLIAPALPGYEGSSALPDPGWPSLARWAAAILDALGISSLAACVGNSFGAAAARAFASYFPARVGRLVLANGGLVPPVPTWLGKAMAWRVMYPLRAAMGSAMSSDAGLRAMIAETGVLTDAFRAEARGLSGTFTSLMLAIAGSGPPEFLDRKVPATIIWGPADKTLPEAKARELAACFADVEVVLLPGVGHMAQLEAPDAFAKEVRRALGASDGPGKGGSAVR